jgi:hypothetical protein
MRFISLVQWCGAKKVRGSRGQIEFTLRREVNLLTVFGFPH